MNVKQVIVMRTDLRMRKGKMIAQGAHASMMFLTKMLRNEYSDELSEAERYWINNSFAKICVRVDSGEELDRIHDEALNAGIKVNMVIDSGKTEFHGQPTPTCLALGPDLAQKIDKITGNLDLL